MGATSPPARGPQVAAEAQQHVAPAQPFRQRRAETAHAQRKPRPRGPEGWVSPRAAARGQLARPPAPSSPPTPPLDFANLRRFPAAPCYPRPTPVPWRTRPGHPPDAQGPAHRGRWVRLNTVPGRHSSAAAPNTGAGLVHHLRTARAPAAQTSSAAPLHSWERDHSGRSCTPSSASSRALPQWPMRAHSTERLPSIVARSSGSRAVLRPVV